MATFVVLYRGDHNQTLTTRFEAEKVVLATNYEWFHFMTGDEVTAWVKADDVRVIEEVPGPLSDRFIPDRFAPTP
jgi:hypothetical protein